MNITQNKELIERVIYLAKRKATGTPMQLAERLSISERNLYRILEFLKDSEKSISYSRTLQSYIVD
ncbi:hypothetical protein BZG02_09280 [Labilibaculum filiforme]|uniref:Helix-turn-helix type 11 domain-containing protein n=1 Tax=Labilibaculum filiforme TaxID=1940526 RepID=A0A2N3HZY7_9BACT|nr:hypothetical protein [Labilibaculum filiforme]PKQ63553.1 hypothetical protein BZG02_09280 [Labilibaculum filiforme]